MRIKKKNSRWLYASCAFMLAIVLLIGLMQPQSASAAVLWDKQSLEEVYNPTGQIYTYAPTVIQEGDTTHMWSCHNNESGIIRDHIYYTKIENNTVVESRSVLAPGPAGTWDSFHVCDPSVVEGKFLYNGTSYSYALFYLGNDVNASYHNQIGVAFSNDLSGDWTRYHDPIITYPNDGYWGVGQPSATSIDGQGRLMLFYTQGDPSATAGYRVELNLGDMSQPVIGTPMQLTTAGLIGTDGNNDWLNNFDIVYDPTRDRFYAIRDQHPFPSGQPNYITESIQLASIDGASIWGGGGAWRVEGNITPQLTDLPRNHNAGLVRTAFGTLPDQNEAVVYFTESQAAPNLTGLPEYTYNIWRITGALSDGNHIIENKINSLSNKYFTVDRLTHELNTQQLNIHGKAQAKLKHKNVWTGYRLFDQKGLLLDAGTAYYNIVDDEDRSFTLTIPKPAAANYKVKLEVYFLTDKGKEITSKSSWINIM
ncbi:hypothetical protein [Paenibacillus sp. IITD108]|uniref:hypothetical protein n=1 Tax=Paenibacillus sp. IITD108 TaxID=3116649 RepID=UPI002F42AC9C